MGYSTIDKSNIANVTEGQLSLDLWRVWQYVNISQ